MKRGSTITASYGWVSGRARLACSSGRPQLSATIGSSAKPVKVLKKATGWPTVLQIVWRTPAGVAVHQSFPSHELNPTHLRRETSSGMEWCNWHAGLPGTMLLFSTTRGTCKRLLALPCEPDGWTAAACYVRGTVTAMAPAHGFSTSPLASVTTVCISLDVWRFWSVSRINVLYLSLMTRCCSGSTGMSCVD